MPRKQRTAKGRRDLPLSEAARYLLVTGIHPGMHVCAGATSDQRWNCEADPSLPRCVGQRPIPGAMGLLFMEEGELEAVWHAHRDELVAEGTAHGFEAAGVAWFDMGTRSSDEAIDPALTAEWRRVFIREYNEEE